MPELYTLDQIKKTLSSIDAVAAIEEGFVKYSEGSVIVPPVGELLFSDPPGDMHIKYGRIIDDELYVVKIASGFYDNIKLDLPAFDGLMLLFYQKTGQLKGILLDEGYLTNIRTAAAGAVAAKYFAPSDVNCIGVFGAGTQGRLQVRYLQDIVDCREIFVWGVNDEELERYKNDMEPEGYTVRTTAEPGEIAERCNLIITATPAKTPLLKADHIKKGTHITALGSDTHEKQELEAEILKNADIVVADSLIQSESRGEIFQAVKCGVLDRDKVVEFGNVIRNTAPRRTSDDQTTIVDLTGVAVQDIQISKAVFSALRKIP
jgi:ornithine cyclodeaminase